MLWPACAAAGGTAGGGCGVAAAVALPLEPPAPRALPAPLAPLLAEQLEEAADALHALPASTCSALICSGSPARSASPLCGLRARLRAPSAAFVPMVFGLRAEIEPEVDHPNGTRTTPDAQVDNTCPLARGCVSPRNPQNAPHACRQAQVRRQSCGFYQEWVQGCRCGARRLQVVQDPRSWLTRCRRPPPALHLGRRRFSGAEH